MLIFLNYVQDLNIFISGWYKDSQCISNISKKSHFPFVILQTLIDVKMTEWANKKGLPPLKDFSPSVIVSQYHTRCVPSDQNKHAKHPLPVKHRPGRAQEERNTFTKQSVPSSSRPWTIFTGSWREKPPRELDLRDSIVLTKDSTSRQLQFTTKWESRPQPAPDLPLDVLERVLFPRAFPSRITFPQHFQPQCI